MPMAGGIQENASAYVCRANKSLCLREEQERVSKDLGHVGGRKAPLIFGGGL